MKQGQSSTPADILVDIVNPYNSAIGQSSTSADILADIFNPYNSVQ